MKSEQAHEVQQLAHHQHRFQAAQAARSTRETPGYPAVDSEQKVLPLPQEQQGRGGWQEQLRRAQASQASVKPLPTDRAAADSPDSDSLRIDDMVRRFAPHRLLLATGGRFAPSHRRPVCFPRRGRARSPSPHPALVVWPFPSHPSSPTHYPPSSSPQLDVLDSFWAEGADAEHLRGLASPVPDACSSP
jgi:hypothetical protein